MFLWNTLLIIHINLISLSSLQQGDIVHALHRPRQLQDFSRFQLTLPLPPDQPKELLQVQDRSNEKNQRAGGGEKKIHRWNDASKVYWDKDWKAGWNWCHQKLYLALHFLLVLDLYPNYFSFFSRKPNLRPGPHLRRFIKILWCGRGTFVPKSMIGRVQNVLIINHLRPPEPKLFCWWVKIAPQNS